VSDIFSGIGQVAGAAITASAMKDAAKMQIEALEKQRKFVYDELAPEKIGAQATAADIDRARNMLALQAQTDPALLQARYKAEEGLVKNLDEVFGPNAPGAAVAAQAEQEALGGGATSAALKQRLIDAALGELDAGASLPPDIQAELVNAGLTRAGQTGAQAGGRRVEAARFIGLEGERIRAERQQRAAQLGTAAQNLETSRANILGQLFPALQAQQLQKQQAAQAALGMSNALMPKAGLTGGDIANIWLARVGATNQLAQQQADIGARAGETSALALGQGIGAAFRTGGAIATNPTVQGWVTPRPETEADVWSSLGV
jgi:hypothetical protein